MPGQAQQGKQGVLDNYVTVAERIADFYQAHPQGRITTAILEHNEETGFILMRAEIFRGLDDAQPSATGHAFEVRGDGYVNKTSYIENAETSCVGRALALLGFEVRRQTAQQRPGPRPVEQQQQAKKPDNLAALHERVNERWKEIVAEGAATEATLAGMLKTYGRQSVAEMTREQALDFGTKLKAIHDEHAARRKQ